VGSRRRHQHEEHANHEAWAIPYGDLVTLLLAFFVVMYAISSLNEGKYRVLADALSTAFGGPPRTISPIQLGMHQLRGSAFDRPSLVTPGSKSGPSASSPISSPRMRQVLDMPTFGLPHPRNGQSSGGGQSAAEGREGDQLHSIGRRIQDALSELVKHRLVTVRRSYTFLEVEIQSDILFASGAADPNPFATDTVRKIAQVLRDEPNALRVEGYTDNVPISTALFRSNWELSAARAASVVHVLTDAGIGPQRLAVVGYGEHQAVADNATEAGRNANRRVLLVILASPQGPDAVEDRHGPVVAMEPEHAPGLAPEQNPAPAANVIAPAATAQTSAAPAKAKATATAARAPATPRTDTANNEVAAHHPSTIPGAG
jgi:chemotaxis protein MotB